MFQVILTSCVVPQVKVSLKARTRIQAKQSNTSLINIHNLNSHLNPENMIITKDFIEKYSNKTPKPVFFQHEQDIILSPSKYTVTSFIDLGPYKNIFSNLLPYAGNLQQELHKYATMKDYTPYNKDRPSSPEEKSRTVSFHAILIECSAKTELIANIINTLRIWFLSLLDIVSNTNHNEYIDSCHLDRSKRSVLGTVFHLLFGGSEGTDQK